MALISVDLPAPFGPSIATISPARRHGRCAVARSAGRARSRRRGRSTREARARSCRRAAEIGLDDARIAAHRLRRRPRREACRPAMTKTRPHSRTTTSMLCSMTRKRDAPPVDLDDAFDDHLEQARIDAGRRLVEQQTRGLGHEHARELEQLALAAGKNPRRLVARAVELDEVEQRPSPVAAARAPPRATRRGASQFGQIRSPLWPCAPSMTFSITRHSRKRARDLEGAAEAVRQPRIGRRRPSTRRAVEPDAARRSASVRRRCRSNSVVLPAPFGPISPTISPRRDVDRDAVDRGDAAETLARGRRRRERACPPGTRSDRLRRPTWSPDQR